MAFYFAWADAAETTFGPEHEVEDEDVFSAVIEHAEGQFPTLALEIRNPRVGLLNPGRQVWAWLSWAEGSSVTPLFFGRLVGVPDNLFAEIVELRFVARPLHYQTLKQAAAQALKVAPNYDPLFLSEERRDDADAILEGYSALWHIDRLASAVTTSDVLEGEDGTEVFTADEVPEKSVGLSIEQPPLTKVQLVADVQWSQSYSGYVNIGTRSFTSYSGDGILSDWPKPLAVLGDGWTVALATAVDVNGVNNAQMITTTTQWQNQERRHINGDTMSIQASESVPDFPGGYISKVISSEYQYGLVDPGATDEDGDPAPINRPAASSVQTAYVPLWKINTALTLRYDAGRQRTERVYLTVTSDVQPVITDDDSAQDFEQVSVSGGDVGMPIANVLRWSTVAGTAVDLGQVIFPDNWTGASTAQICTTAGTCGLAAPTFSDIAGTTTTDGTAVWTSLGANSSIGSSPDWQANSYTPLGTVILPRRPVSIPYSWLVQQGRVEVPRAGVNVNVGTIVSTGTTYQQCTVSGTTGIDTPSFSATYGATTVDGSVTWESLGTSLPSGSVFYICTAAGTSGAAIPEFDETDGATTTDGTVTWTSLGASEVPIGGAVGETGRNAFFPTDRGLQSIEYLICLARARLRLRSRVVRVAWDIPFSRALSLSCRKSATLQDPRLPGGEATGKIIAYSISANGDSGELKGSVVIGCAVGNGTSVTLDPGAPAYVASGYVETGYQYTSAQDAIGTDIGYTPPAAGDDPDALTFPLTRDQAVKFEMVHGTLAAQTAAVNEALGIAGNDNPLTNPQRADLLAFFADKFETVQESKLTVADALKAVPIWYELELVSLTGGPFQAAYYVQTTPLVIPKTIDLAADAA